MPLAEVPPFLEINMREGKPSVRFGARGLQTISLGGGSTPLLMKIYGSADQVLATLTEQKGECIDPGYVDFFLGPNCRPAKYKSYIVEILPDGTTGVLHDNPAALGADFPQWIAFLEKWVARHEEKDRPCQVDNPLVVA